MAKKYNKSVNRSQITQKRKRKLPLSRNDFDLDSKLSDCKLKEEKFKFVAAPDKDSDVLTPGI